MICPPRDLSCLGASLEIRKKTMTWLSLGPGEGEVPTGVEEEGCSAEALHDEVSRFLKCNMASISLGASALTG